jgi:hypothetical protein
MREETRPILGPVLGIFAGAIPTYWASRELWVVWKTSTKSKLVHLLLGPHVKVTTGVIHTLRSWFAAVVIVEAFATLFPLLLLFFPRRHFLWGAMIILANAVGLALLDYFPYAIGTQELYSGLIVCPILGFLAGVSALVFRSDLEFARAYGFD